MMTEKHNCNQVYVEFSVKRKLWFKLFFPVILLILYCASKLRLISIDRASDWAISIGMRGLIVNFVD